jgi:hypothetical protein
LVRPSILEGCQDIMPQAAQGDNQRLAHILVGVEKRYQL